MDLKLGARVAQWVRSLDLTTHTSLSLIRCGFALLCTLKKGCIRLASANDKVYQLLAHGRWFSAGTPASSTTKTGRHDIAEILLKVAIKHHKSNQINGFEISWLSNLLILTVPGKYYSRTALCALNLISTVVFGTVNYMFENNSCVRDRPNSQKQSESIKKGALDSDPQVIKFSSCLPMGGGCQGLRLLPPLKLIAMM